jgi:hypothetical protein
LREGLPDFLRRNIRGNSDSELFFHLILAGLHTQNALEGETGDDAIVSAVGTAVKRIDELAGAATSTLNMILSNGRGMCALRRGPAFGYREHEGLEDPAEPGEERHSVRPGSPPLHYTILVSGGAGVPNGFEALADASLLTLTREQKLKTYPLAG